MSTEHNHGINYNKFKIDIDESGNSFWNSDELYFINGTEEETKSNKKQQRKDVRRKDCALILFGFLCCDGYYNCL